MSDLLTATGATFSPCREYRYRLWRRWDASRPSVCWVMLNPSTADEETNDPTVERCSRRALSWGYGAIEVVNLFALRSTDPKYLARHADPVGPGNDEAILAAARGAGLVICAWGEHGNLGRRGRTVSSLLADAGLAAHALKLSKSGQPCHPLYLPYSLQPTPMLARAA